MSATEALAATAASPTPDIVWDGRSNSYRPGPGWRERLSPDLVLHEAEDPGLDPVTYEVIRHRLWTINMAHGETVTRISGSPVFASLDFNMSILTEDAEVVMNAPFIQFLNIGAPYGIRYIMEKFGDDPGVYDGDVYIANDPWIGAVHEMDVLFACPVFVDGKLFSWVSNAGHQYDLGGVVPGGWPQSAVDVYHDPVVFSPFKIVERGELRPDLERMYLRQSRMPDLVALDFRAQLSGCRFAARQITDLCEQFGAETVKAAMRRIVETAQQAFAAKLERIPDGTWSEVRYIDEKLPGDRGSYRVQVNLTKEGDRLKIDNAGTDDQQEGPIGITFLSLAGALLSVLSVSMLYDQLFAIGGAERQIDYDVEPGLLNCVRHPAAVSAGILNVVTHMGLVQTCINRMLVCDPELRGDIFAAAPDYSIPVVTGTNDKGEFYGSAILDHLSMGGGARASSDGVNTGGPSWSPLTFLLNVESVEQWYPLIYLWRRELTDGGGAGRWRGGTGLSYAWTPYRAARMDVVTFGGGMCVSGYGAEGMFGGYPSPSARMICKHGTDLHQTFADGRMPASIDEIAAIDVDYPAQKTNGIALRDGDVFEALIVGGGGYGDPLTREPEQVAADYRDGYISNRCVTEVHGVAVDERGELDPEGTVALRERLRGERATWARADAQWPVIGSPTFTPATGEPRRMVHEYLVARDDQDQRVLACASCDTVVSDYAGSYRSGLLALESSVTDVPLSSDPTRYIDDAIALRRYCCPGCHVLMSTEVVKVDEPINDEMRLG